MTTLGPRLCCTHSLASGSVRTQEGVTMVTQALYRRWRSQTFSQIIGQDHVTHTLLNALRAGALSVAELRAVLAETEAQIAALRGRVRRRQARLD